MIPKVLIYWQELVETLEEGHYILLVEAGQEETEEKTVGEVHLEEEEVYGEEADTKEVVERAQRLELLEVMGLESSVIVRCGVARGLYFFDFLFSGLLLSSFLLFLVVFFLFLFFHQLFFFLH